MDEAVLERLERIGALLALAFYDDIQRAVAQIREDPVAASALDEAEDWTRSGQLQDAVIAATGAARRTVQRRIGELVGRQLMESRGSTSTLEYRARRL